MSEEFITKGRLFHREKAIKYDFLLDETAGLIYCNQSSTSRIFRKTLVLVGCDFPDYPSNFYTAYTDFGESTSPSFDISMGGQTYAIFEENKTTLNNTKEAFLKASHQKYPWRYKRWGKLAYFFISAAGIPFKITNTICKGIEKIEEKLEETPEIIFKTGIKTEKPPEQPMNLASGLIMGTKKIITGCAKGLSGVILEPFRGAKQKGIRGATIGLGKGIIGLVCRPVAGALGFVTLTVRGVNNTPKCCCTSLAKAYKKHKDKKEEEKQDEFFFDQEIDPAEISYVIELEDIHEKSSEGIEDREEALETHRTNNEQYEEWISEVCTANGFSLELPSIQEMDTTELQIQAEKERNIELKKMLYNLLNHIDNTFHFNSETENADMEMRIKEICTNEFEEYPEIIEEDVAPELWWIANKQIRGDEPMSELSFSESEPENPWMVRAETWNYSKANDLFRMSTAYPKGGLACIDKDTVSTLRSTAKEIVKQIGRKILKGDMNLTQIPFPIKCMEPTTALHMIVKSMGLTPIYMSIAAMNTSPLERVKLITTGLISAFKESNTFLKPLNPILGETLSGEFEDGTKFFLEQTSHHPPTSHFLLEGPKSLYEVSGYMIYEAHASLNSVKISNIGKRVVRFSDGQVLETSFPEDSFINIFFGEFRHEILGRFTVSDKGNELEAIVKVGQTPKKPSDEIEGVIVSKGSKVVSKFGGNYLGFLDFDGRRYWDVREYEPVKYEIYKVLPSDSDWRIDLNLLHQGRIEEAQNAKDRMEQHQRIDAKNRHK